MPSIPLFVDKGRSVQIEENQIEGLMTFTEEDAQFISNMSLSECTELRSQYEQLLQDCIMTSIDDAETEAIIDIYQKLGSKAEYDYFINFSKSYLMSEGGVESFIKLLPKNLSDAQKNLYLSRAIAIDRLSRPIYNFIESENKLNSYEKDGHPLCKLALECDLAKFGILFSAEAFLDIVSAGSLTALDGIAIAWEALAVYENYEMCNMRYH